LFPLAASGVFSSIPRMRSVAVFVALTLCVACAAASSMDVGRSAIMAHVADAFANKGFLREDPFELSPQQAAKLDPHLMDMLKESLLESQAETTVATPELVLASLKEQVAAQEKDNVAAAQELEAKVQFNQQRQASAAADNSVAPELLETQSNLRRRGVFGHIIHAGKRLIGKVAGGLQRTDQALHGDLDKFRGTRLEDCMACRFIWKQVEMDVSNAKYVEDVQASFEHNCLDAQKSSIFYKACEDMYDDMYALTDDYMSSDYTVDKMCQRSNMCKL